MKTRNTKRIRIEQIKINLAAAFSLGLLIRLGMFLLEQSTVSADVAFKVIQ
jgi:hypothetical protein